MFNISPAPAALAKRASKALSSAKLMFSRCRPPLGLDLSALSPPRSYAICARFTVLSEAPIASAIAGCVIPPSRSSTIWMRWRRFGSPFQRSAVFNRRTWALVHLTISSPESDDQRESQAGSLAKGSNSRTPAQKRRFNQLWSRYEDQQAGEQHGSGALDEIRDEAGCGAERYSGVETPGLVYRVEGETGSERHNGERNQIGSHCAAAQDLQQDDEAAAVRGRSGKQKNENSARTQSLERQRRGHRRRTRSDDHAANVRELGFHERDMG